LLLTTAKVMGVAAAAWAVIRSLVLIVLGLVFVRWNTLSENSSPLDATPQRSFLMVVVLPLAALATVGLFGDLRALLRTRTSAKGFLWLRVTSVTATAALLLGLLERLLRSPP
jgi:hypothetical protein